MCPGLTIGDVCFVPKAINIHFGATCRDAPNNLLMHCGKQHRYHTARGIFGEKVA
jgi:hypothetical protein